MTVYTGAPTTLVAGDTSALVTKFNDHRDALKALTEAWTTYGSGASWTSTGTAPAIGNGTWSGRYRQLNKTVDFTVRITMGTTTTYGTGSYRIALPVAINTASPGRFVVALVDTSAGSTYHGITYNVATTVAPIGVDSGAAGGVIAAITATVPFTFASTDIIDLVGTYEAA